MRYIIIYWITSVIIESINFYLAWKKFNSGVNNNYLVKAFVDAINTTASGKKLKKDFINPFTMFIAFICFVVACPFIFMITTYGWIKKLVGYKSAEDKAVDAEKKAIEDAKKKSEEFMRTEGDMPAESKSTSQEIIEHLSPEVIVQIKGENNTMKDE